MGGSTCAAGRGRRRRRSPVTPRRSSRCSTWRGLGARRRAARNRLPTGHTGGMPLDTAHLSSLSTALDELAQRITTLADELPDSPREDVAADLYEVERHLQAAAPPAPRARSTALSADRTEARRGRSEERPRRGEARRRIPTSRDRRRRNWSRSLRSARSVANACDRYYLTERGSSGCQQRHSRVPQAPGPATGQPMPALGQKSASTQSPHRGLRATQTARPCRISRRLNTPRSRGRAPSR